MTEKILVVEDEDMLRNSLGRFLKTQGHDVDSVSTGRAVAPLLERCTYDIVISDIVLGDMDGIEVLRHVRAVAPATAVLMMTAYGTMDSAIQAFRTGAYDYLLKPFSLDELESRIKNIVRFRKLVRENTNLRAEVRRRHNTAAMVGKSRAMNELMRQVQRVAPASCNVLITGESGTGKELVARAIHELSPNRDALLVPLNMAAIPENLIESYLFGHRRGAFTGADRARDGLFRTAADGTLFLDEIGELPLGVQPKLLRALEEKEIMPVGSDVPVKVNTRVIAAQGNRAM